MLSSFLRRAVAALLLCASFVTSAEAPVVLVTGDSLSAAYGIPLEQGWVALLQQRLREQGYPQRVVNTSISGETTAGALARLPKELAAHKPKIVLIELGANDGFRGLPLATMQANLRKMAALARKSGAKPALFEIRIPENYGPRYTTEFRKSFSLVAKQEKAPLVPFFLAEIALQPKWFLEDGTHPTAAAQPKLLEAVWPTLKPLLGKAAPKQADNVP